MTPVQNELLDKIYAKAQLKLQNSSQSDLSGSSEAPGEYPSITPIDMTPAPPALAMPREQQQLLASSVIQKLLSTLELPAVASAKILHAMEQVGLRVKKQQGQIRKDS